MTARLFAIAASLLTLGLSARALADAIPPEQGACDGKSAGAACETGGSAGTCVAATCSRLDYSHGTPPRSVDYACVKCDTSATPPATVETSGGDTQASAEPAPTTNGTKAAGTGGCAGGELDAGALGVALALAACGARRRQRPQ